MLSQSEAFVDGVDRLTRRLQRNLDCCDKSLVSCCGLTAAQAASLLTLREHGALTMNEFANQMRLHGTTMTRMVDALVEKGLVERLHDSSDRRIIHVTFTPHGREVVEQVILSKREFFSAAFSGLSDKERTNVIETLEQLAVAVEDRAARCCH